MSTVTEARSQDLRHPAKDDPYARESVVYMAHVPDLDATVAVYAWVTGLGEAGTSAVLMRAGQPTLAERQPDVPIADDADFDDFRLGPLHLEHREAGRTAHVTWSGEQFSFTMDFTGTHEPYAYASSPHGCPSYVADDRVEQSGRVDLELRVDGTTSHHAATGHRDHSWGARNWKMMQHYKWVQAQTTEEGIHLFEISALGTTTVYGYVFRDGELAHVAEAAFRPTFDSERFVTRLEVDILDTLARRTQLVAVEQARTEIPVSPDAVLVDSTVNVEINGTAGGGWVDFAWPPDYLQHMREHAWRYETVQDHPTEDAR